MDKAIKLIVIYSKYYYASAKSWLGWASGVQRLLYGFCPLCNSDAPEIYDCPLCEGRHAAKGDNFPPAKEVKAAWRKEWDSVRNVGLVISGHILNSRLKRVNKA